MGAYPQPFVSKPPAIKNLAISGAGGLGFTLLGMVDALQDHDKLEDLEKVSGTSAGAMMALLVCLGYRDGALDQVAMNQKFEKFTDLDVREVFRMPGNILKKGVFSGKELEGWCQYVIAKRTGMPVMGFDDLHEHIAAAKRHDENYFKEKYTQALQNLDHYKEKFKQYDPDFNFDFSSWRNMKTCARKMTDLYVVASEVVGDPKRDEAPYKETCFSHENKDFAHIPIAQGIKASAGFPFVFCTQEIKDAKGKKHCFRDGGLTNNYPLEVFDYPDGSPNPHTLGVGISVKKAEQNGQAQDGKQMRQFKKLAGFFGWPVEQTLAVFKRHEADELTDKRDTSRTVLTAVEGDVVDFNLTPAKRKEYFQQGYDRMDNHIRENYPEVSLQSQIMPVESPNIKYAAVTRTPAGITR